MRVRLTIAYNGAFFEGFQEQAHTQNTITGTLCKALQSLGIFEKPVGSGRTDRGVHALRQVLHLDLPDFWKDLSHLRDTLNRYLNPTIHVRNIQETSFSFHARFSATMRHYRYIIWHGECLPFWAQNYAFIPSFSIQAANNALSLMEGKHDFAYFKKEGSQIKNTQRNLYKAHCYRRGNFSIFSFKANGFLRSQVRLMVGAALAQANGKLTLEELEEQLDVKKLYFKKPAPPEGLYLVRVYYPL